VYDASYALLAQAWLLAAAIMLCLWSIETRTDDAGLVDVGWSGGIGAVALYLAFVSGGWLPRRCLVGTLAVMWSLRLAGYLLVDRISRREEDFRYRSLRERWGDRAHFYFLLMFLLQSVLVIPFAVPLFVLMANERQAFSRWELAGALLALGAVAAEATADYQLARFRNAPRNRGAVCRWGLWRYSRHPNYFFEWLHWLSYSVMAVGVPGWQWTLTGSIGILIPLFLLTGIPATEAQALKSRGEKYRAYQRSTSMFVPWFPKRRMAPNKRMERTGAS
jgi:steroid 5-alpha reductase family enzyme